MITKTQDDCISVVSGVRKRTTESEDVLGTASSAVSDVGELANGLVHVEDQIHRAMDDLSLAVVALVILVALFSDCESSVAPQASLIP